MQHASFVREGEPSRHAAQDSAGLGEGERPPAEPLREALALDEVEGDPEPGPGSPRGVDPHHVGVNRGRGEAFGFALEARHELGGGVGSEDLERALAASREVAGPIDRAHSPGPELTPEFVAAESLRESVWR